MAFFNKSEDQHGRLDWQILQNGWTSLYFNTELLNTAIQWFEKENYKVLILDCIQWTSKDDILKGIGKELNFPDYYGKNLSALNDCLWDIEIAKSGLVVVFTSFDLIDKELAYDLLDIFATNSRSHFLFGDRLITLVQVNDAHYHCEPVGANPVLWNPKEWLNSSRGI